jgi:hypothetical protein
MFATPEEAAWEWDPRRLELGSEAEGYYNFRLSREGLAASHGL